MPDALPGTVFYLDTSALVKRYAAETGSSRVTAICHPLAGNIVAAAQITKAEAAAAFATKYRNRGISRTGYASVLQDLTHDFSYEYWIVKIDQALVDLAVELTQRQKLRGYDAVQLAAALTLKGLLAQTPLLSLTFVAADDELLQAARNEGLLAENPIHYPD